MGYRWKDCVNGHTLGHPTLADKLIGHVECAMCGAKEPVDDFERRVAIEELLTRLNMLETLVGPLNTLNQFIK